jgi:hypothetical protein
MQKVKIFGMCLLVFFLALAVMTPAVWAAEGFKVTAAEFGEHKKAFDDPRPYLTTLTYKKVLPPEVYAKLTYDVEAMKSLWAEIVGFRSSDVVGKIAPEIKPGTYSYRDKEKYPGIKELMIPLHYEVFFKPGGPPFAGNFPEIKVVPTRQYYWNLPSAKATKKYMGRSQLDDQGIIKEETYVAGLPFPRPSGKFKANQILYNLIKTPFYWDNTYSCSVNKGFTRTLRIDQDMLTESMSIRLKERVEMEPYGWFDERAKKLGEVKGFNFIYLAPRDMYGNVMSSVTYLDPDKFDLMMVYVNVLRRVRVLSATDIQDAIGGADYIYADKDGFGGKLSATIFPYKCEVIAEREYLVPSHTLDGSEYMSSKGYEMRNYEWERRPMYVVKMTQLDKGFVYSYRIAYVDKETFMLNFIENYDQKGRLYRSMRGHRDFIPEMGQFGVGIGLGYDHLDLHTSFTCGYQLPAPWVNRSHISLRGLVLRGK